jgi:osmotically-inducible protein OsmY
MRTYAAALLVSAALIGCEKMDAPSGPVTNQNPPAPNNTAVNERDADGATKTPIDQNENQADVNRTAEIRKRVLDTKDMSVNARNAKIITANGKVTLRGPVDSEAERDTIAKIATDVAGEGNVDNQLEVVPKNP